LGDIFNRGAVAGMNGRLKTECLLMGAIAAGIVAAAGILYAPPAAADPPLWPDGSHQEVLREPLRQWLSARQRPIRIGVTTIPPQVFFNPDNGQLSGLCIDYIRELETILSCRFDVVHFDTWAAMMSAAISRDIDAIYAAQKTPLREQSFLFTQPYLIFENKIVTTEEVAGLLTLSDLAGKRVAVVRGSAIEEFLSANYPQIERLPVDDELIGLSRVSFQQADAMVIEIARASWYIQQNKFTNLKIAGDAGYPFKLGFAVRNDWPELTAILDAGLSRIGSQRRGELLSRWIIPLERNLYNLRVVIAALAGLGALVFVVIVWNRLLSVRVRQRTAELQQELAAHQNDLSQLRRFETVISLSDDMMAFVDADYVVRAVNDAFLKRLFGKPKEDILHHRVEDLFEPAFYQSIVLPHIEKALRGQIAVYTGWTTAGLMKERYLNATFHPYHNAGGRIEGVAVVVHDITDIQVALQQLQDRENRLNSIIAAAPVGIGVVRHRVFQSVNKLICIITGYSEQELLGQSARMLYPTQEDYDYVGAEKYRQIDKFGIGTVETRWLRKDGRVIDVLLSSVPLDPADLSKGVTFTALDITDRKAAEAALENSQKTLERLIGNLRGIAFRCLITPDWPMEFISRYCLEMTGYDEEAFYSGQISWGKLIIDEDNKRIFRQIAEQLNKKEPYQIEYRIRTRSGELRWFWEQGCGVFDDQGNAVALEGFITDITDRRLAEDALLASESRYRELIDLAVDGILLGSHDGVIIEANAYMETLLGVPRDRIVGQHIRTLFDAETLEQTPLRFDLLRRGQTVVSERTLRRADGQAIAIEMRTKMMPDGTYQSIIRDITERKRIEQALRKSEEQFRRLFENALFGVALHQMLLDDKGMPVDYVFLDANPAFERHTGLRPADLIGKRATEVFNHFEKAPFIEIYGNVAICEVPIVFEQYFENLSRHYNICAYPLGGNRFATVFEDITQRKNADAAREQLLKELRSKNEELQSIVFIASHDLHSPLVTIRGFAGELERSIQDVKTVLAEAVLSDDLRRRLSGPLDKDIPEALAFINKGNRKMDQLLNGLLRLSRIGTVELHTAPLNMNTLMAEIIGSPHYDLRRRQADIAVEGDLPACCGDATLITQVFANLIDNAVKYRHPDRPAVVRIRGRSEDGRSVYQVEDNGIGIAPEHKDKIFEIFHQLNPNAGGEGLGLTIVRRILDRQDGKIWVDSRPQQGTIVSVSLPAAANK